MQHPSRRAVVFGLAAAAASGRARAASSSPEDRVKLANERLAAIETREGGRLGVVVLDSGGGPGLAHRAGERFPMCSTFKLMASAAALKRVDEGKERLDRVIPYGPGDLLEYAPVTKAHVADGGMTLGSLCAAEIDWSDNTAANLILDAIGGPAGFTAFMRSVGDSTTRLDRNEPTLNTSVPGDERDTTTPQAMAEGVQKVLLGNVLSEAWLIGDKVGDKRLRAGLPASWGRRQDRQRRSRHSECDRDHPAARPGAAHRRRLLHRIRCFDGCAQRDPQGDRRDHRRNVLSRPSRSHDDNPEAARRGGRLHRLGERGERKDARPDRAGVEKACADKSDQAPIALAGYMNWPRITSQENFHSTIRLRPRDRTSARTPRRASERCRGEAPEWGCLQGKGLRPAFPDARLS
jgi:beta-lactamase class A